MRIVHVFRRLNLADGGVVRAVLDMCDLLARAGHDVKLASWEGTDAPESWTGADGTPEVVRLGGPDRFLGRLSAARRAALRRELEWADVVHLHDIWDLSSLQVARIAREATCPYVVTVHGMLDDWSMRQRGAKKRLYLALFGRRLLDGAATVHCTASAERDQASRWFGATRTHVVPCLFAVEPYRELPGPEAARRAWPELQGDEPVVLFLSRLHHKKGPELLIDAVALRAGAGDSVRLVLAGSGAPAYEAALRRRVAEHGLEASTTFTGLVEGDEKVSLYEAADLFVLPTGQENFGIVFPESLAARTPVLTTRGVDIWRELEESGGARIIEPDAASIAETIGELLERPEQREVMGEAGRAWVFETFDGDAITRAYEGMYEAVARNRDHPT
jgi:glycosyltransferase involved in cell wall biosynthesis